MPPETLPKSVLVVDDELEIAIALVAILEHAGYAVMRAVTGSEALKQLRQGHFDYVLTDILMPDIDGLQIIAAVRQYQREAVVIAMSGGGNYFTPDEALQMAKKVGARRLLQKPFRADDLLACLRDSA